MARKIEITLVDDVDGTAADETVLFGIDGTQYEIDLSADNAASLRNALAQYVGGARKAGRSKGPSAGRSRASKPQGSADNPAIRRWATDNGYETSSRGRIPAALILAYEGAVA